MEQISTVTNPHAPCVNCGTTDSTEFPLKTTGFDIKGMCLHCIKDRHEFLTAHHSVGMLDYLFDETDS